MCTCQLRPPEYCKTVLSRVLISHDRDILSQKSTLWVMMDIFVDKKDS